MGVAYKYILVGPKGNAVASVSTHAIGYGYKWGEFIGTPRGQKVLAVLNEKFSKPNRKWEIWDENDYEDVDDELEDMGMQQNIRDELLKQNLTSQESLVFWDAIMATEFSVVKEVWGSSVPSVPSVTKKRRSRSRSTKKKKTRSRSNKKKKTRKD